MRALARQCASRCPRASPPACPRSREPALQLVFAHVPLQLRFPFRPIRGGGTRGSLHLTSQDYLLRKAEKHCVPCVENSNLDRSLGLMHLTLLG